MINLFNSIIFKKESDASNKQKIDRNKVCFLNKFKIEN